MIVYTPDTSMHYADYGIGIPRLGSIGASAMAALETAPGLAGRLHELLLRVPPVALGRQELLLAHDAAYVDLLLSAAPEAAVMETFELLRPDGSYNRYFPERAKRPLKDVVPRCLAGTAQACAAVPAAVEHGFVFHFGGGRHHALAGGGRGFCLVNDVVIAARLAQRDQGIETVWIIDVDAHKGDGTAALTYEDDTILTLSAHMAHGWPLDEAPFDEAGRLKPWFLPSTVDVPVREGGESGYVKALGAGLDLLEALSFGRAPGLAIVVAGSDPYEHDELESTRALRLTAEQMLERDLLVYDFLESRGVPHCWLMSGGYGARSFEIYAQFLAHVLPARLGS